jgi:hypothetical protein
VDGGTTDLAVAAFNQSPVLECALVDCVLAAPRSDFEPGSGGGVGGGGGGGSSAMPYRCPASSAAIAAAVEWCHHEWYSELNPLPESLKRVVQGHWVAAFVARLVADVALFAQTVKVADFLALEGLLATLLHSQEGAGSDGVDLLVATKAEVPQLASLLCDSLALGIKNEIIVALLRVRGAVENAGYGHYPLPSAGASASASYPREGSVD